MGKPIKEAKEEIEFACGKNDDGYMQLLHDSLKPQTFGNSVIVRHSIGVVVILSPWNFPVDEILLLALPSLASGNTGKKMRHLEDIFSMFLIYPRPRRRFWHGV